MGRTKKEQYLLPSFKKPKVTAYNTLMLGLRVPLFLYTVVGLVVNKNLTNSGRPFSAFVPAMRRIPAEDNLPDYADEEADILLGSWLRGLGKKGKYPLDAERLDLKNKAKKTISIRKTKYQDFPSGHQKPSFQGFLYRSDKPDATHKKITVFVHGLGGNAFDFHGVIKACIKESETNLDFQCDYASIQRHKTGDLAAQKKLIAERLRDLVKQGYDDITLSGYSYGAGLVRVVYHDLMRAAQSNKKYQWINKITLHYEAINGYESELLTGGAALGRKHAGKPFSIQRKLASLQQELSLTQSLRSKKIDYKIPPESNNYVVSVRIKDELGKLLKDPVIGYHNASDGRIEYGHRLIQKQLDSRYYTEGNPGANHMVVVIHPELYVDLKKDMLRDRQAPQKVLKNMEANVTDDLDLAGVTENLQDLHKLKQKYGRENRLDKAFRKTYKRVQRGLYSRRSVLHKSMFFKPENITARLTAFTDKLILDEKSQGFFQVAKKLFGLRWLSGKNRKKLKKIAGKIKRRLKKRDATLDDIRVIIEEYRSGANTFFDKTFLRELRKYQVLAEAHCALSTFSDGRISKGQFDQAISYLKKQTKDVDLVNLTSLEDKIPVTGSDSSIVGNLSDSAPKTLTGQSNALPNLDSVEEPVEPVADLTIEVEAEDENKNKPQSDDGTSFRT